MITILNSSIRKPSHFFLISLALMIWQLSQPLAARADEILNGGTNISKNQYKTLAEEHLNENTHVHASVEKESYFHCHAGHEHDLTTHILAHARTSEMVLKENINNVAIHKKISMQQNRKIPSNKKIQIRLSEMEPRTHQSHIRVLF